MADFALSKRGNVVLKYAAFTYYKQTERNHVIRWACSSHYSKGCKARIITHQNELVSINENHIHAPCKRYDLL